MTDRTLIVLPARLASTRLPEKLLRRVGGKSILHHTFLAAVKNSITNSIVVAVDDSKLADEVKAFGGEFVMTSVACPSGTDRIAEVARMKTDFDIFINVQGDEPEVSPEAISRVGRLLIENPSADMATIGTPIREIAQLENPACVKIVVANASSQGRDNFMQAIYFSRSPVPHLRGGVTQEALAGEPPLFWHHIGLYAYRRNFLQWFSSQPPSLLEQTEKLEQLRAIESGKSVVVARVASAFPGIDTAEDLLGFESRLAKQICE